MERAVRGTKFFSLNLALFMLSGCLLMAQFYCGTLALVDGAFFKPSIFRTEYIQRCKLSSVSALRAIGPSFFPSSRNPSFSQD